MEQMRQLLDQVRQEYDYCLIRRPRRGWVRALRQLHTTIDDAIDAAGLPLLGVIPEDPDVPLLPEPRTGAAGSRTTTPPGPMKTLRNASWGRKPR